MRRLTATANCYPFKKPRIQRAASSFLLRHAILNRVFQLVSNELVISSTQKGDRIALLQDKRLQEYHVEELDSSFTVGDLYLGTIKKLSSGLNAAFVDVGHEKDGFLHYQDLGPNINSLNKFTKDIIAKRANTGRLNNFKLEPEIEKSAKSIRY